VVAAIKEKAAAAEEGEEDVDGDAKALFNTTATVPFKFKQVKLADFYITSRARQRLPRLKRTPTEKK
jgi:hypothetical protein